MCDTYVDDPEMSKGENAILRAMNCAENNRQLGHCVVYHPRYGWNVPGYGHPPVRQAKARVMKKRKARGRRKP